MKAFQTRRFTTQSCFANKDLNYTSRKIHEPISQQQSSFQISPTLLNKPHDLNSAFLSSQGPRSPLTIRPLNSYHSQAEELRELSDQMVCHIVQSLKFHLTKFYSFHLSLMQSSLNSKMRKFKIKLSEHRCHLLSNLIQNLCQRNFQIILADLEIMPRLFDKEADKELLLDVYPIIKLLAQFNSEKAQYDYSFRNLLSNKLTQASNNLSKIGLQTDSEFQLLETETPATLMEGSLSNSKRNSKSLGTFQNPVSTTA